MKILVALLLSSGCALAQEVVTGTTRGLDGPVSRINTKPSIWANANSDPPLILRAKDGVLIIESKDGKCLIDPDNSIIMFKDGMTLDAAMAAFKKFRETLPKTP